MELEKALKIAYELLEVLRPACERLVIAGSIRREKPEVGDIELLAIPQFVLGVDRLDWELGAMMYRGILGLRRNKKGFKTYGPKNKLMVHLESGIGVDIFSTTAECWPVALVVRTGGKVTNQRIATAALRKGYRFHAYGSGFTTPNGELVCRSEREVFETAGLPYLDPWRRE